MRWRNTIGSSSSMSAAEPEQSATACSTDSIGMTTLTHPSASGGPAVAATASPTVDKRCEQPGQRRSLSAACRLSLTLPRLTVVAFRLRLPLAAGRSRPAAAKRPENTRAAAAGGFGLFSTVNRPTGQDGHHPPSRRNLSRRCRRLLAPDGDRRGRGWQRGKGEIGRLWGLEIIFWRPTMDCVAHPAGALPWNSPWYLSSSRTPPTSSSASRILSRPWKTSTRRWWARFQASASG